MSQNQSRLFIGPKEARILDWIESIGGIVKPKDAVIGITAEGIVRQENQVYAMMKNLRKKGFLEFNEKDELVLIYKSDTTPFNPEPEAVSIYNDEWSEDLESLYTLLEEKRHSAMINHLEYGMDGFEKVEFYENINRIMGGSDVNLRFQLFLEVLDKMKPVQFDALAKILGLSESDKLLLQREHENYKRLKQKEPEYFMEKLDDNE